MLWFCLSVTVIPSLSTLEWIVSPDDIMSRAKPAQKYCSSSLWEFCWLECTIKIFRIESSGIINTQLQLHWQTPYIPLTRKSFAILQGFSTLSCRKPLCPWNIWLLYGCLRISDSISAFSTGARQPDLAHLNRRDYNVLYVKCISRICRLLSSWSLSYRVGEPLIRASVEQKMFLTSWFKTETKSVQSVLWMWPFFFPFSCGIVAFTGTNYF